MKRTFLIALILSCAASICPAQPLRVFTGERTRLRPDIPIPAAYVENEIVVRFAPGECPDHMRPYLAEGKTGVAAVDRLGKTYGADRIVPLFPGARPKLHAGSTYDLSGWFKIRFAGAVDIERVVGEYAALPGILEAEPISIRTVSAVPNDGDFASQWHLDMFSDHDIDAPEAWDHETGDTSIIVAILDSGVRYFHKDIGGADAGYGDPAAADGNMWINRTEQDGIAGIDDDVNGYIDDWIGWDFVDGAEDCWSGEDCDTLDNDPRDFNGHGTHCAGNIAAMNNNGYAVCSVAGGWGSGAPQPAGNGVKVMALRVGWSARFLLFEIGMVRMDFCAQALYYAAENGARIASCSWESENDGGLAAAIDYFLAAGGMIFKSAGNDDIETPDYMCGRPDIISVAATDSNDCKAGFSSFGTWVDISAPGVGIYSLYHDHDDPENDCIAPIDGTSMATPIAAGAAALIWSRRPDYTAAQVEQRLYDTADDIDSLPCNSPYTGKLGAGRINAFRAVDFSGTGVEDGGRPGGAGRFTLHRNYPNPFNPVTAIRFELPRRCRVRLEIFDVRGRFVSTLVDGELPAGGREVRWNGRDETGRMVASGLYFCRLVTPAGTRSMKMVLLR